MSVRISVRGNLGSSFNLKPVVNPNTQDSSLVLNFSIASPSFKRNSEGKNEVVSTEWIDCEYWNRDAAHLHKILKTGMPVYAEGDERFETYTNKENIEVRTRRLRVQNLFIVPNERIEGILLRAKRELPAETDSPDDTPF